MSNGWLHVGVGGSVDVRRTWTEVAVFELLVEAPCSSDGQLYGDCKIIVHAAKFACIGLSYCNADEEETSASWGFRFDSESKARTLSKERLRRLHDHREATKLVTDLLERLSFLHLDAEELVRDVQVAYA